MNKDFQLDDEPDPQVVEEQGDPRVRPMHGFSITVKEKIRRIPRASSFGDPKLIDGCWKVTCDEAGGVLRCYLDWNPGERQDLLSSYEEH